MKRFAEFISLIFHFIFVAPVTVFLLMKKFPIEQIGWNWIYPVLLICIYYIFPISILTFFYKTKRVSDLDVTKRSERNLLSLVVFSFVFVSSIGLLFVPVQLIYKFSTVYTVCFAILFGTVTYFWKISYHMGVLGWFVSTVGLLYGFHFYTFICAVVLCVLVAWSRIYLKKHTLFQTVVGLSFAVILYFSLYKLFF